MSKHDTVLSMLTAALDISREHGYNRITRQEVARRAGCSEALVSCYLGSVSEIKTRALLHARELGAWDVVSQGVVLNDPALDDMTDGEKADSLQRFQEGKCSI